MVLFVRIKPNQRKDLIEKIAEEWQIRLKAPATDGKANENLVAFLSSVLAIPKASITIKRGHTSRMKYLSIDAEEAYVIEKLNSCILK